MEALFIENTSQAIKDYFNKSHKSTIATSAQKSSRHGDSNESSKNKKRDDNTVPLNGVSNDRKQSEEQEVVAANSENTDPKDKYHSLIINGENEKKYSRIDDSLPYLAFIIEAKCGKFKSLTLSLWKSLEHVKIGDSCCSKCKNVYIAFCTKLLSINIGKSSFSSAKLDIRGYYLLFH